MTWLDRLLVIASTIAVVLTLRHLARTIQNVMSHQPEMSVRKVEEIGSSAAPPAFDRVWADDVLAEEERADRNTRGAPDHFSDVCTHWEEQDERDALREQAIRVHRDSQRSP